MTRSFRIAVLALAIVGVAPCVHAAPVVFTANLNGPSEDPPNASPGIGFAQVDFDIVAHTMRVQATFSGLIGTTTMAHIHAPTPLPLTGTAGVATQTPSFIGFPLGVTSGTFDNTYNTLDASTYRAAFITDHGSVAGAEAALFSYLNAGRAYFNIHSTAFPPGEIRGFLQPQAEIPEPATLSLMGLGSLGLLLARRRARRR